MSLTHSYFPFTWCYPCSSSTPASFQMGRQKLLFLIGPRSSLYCTRKRSLMTASLLSTFLFHYPQRMSKRLQEEDLIARENRVMFIIQGSTRQFCLLITLSTIKFFMQCYKTLIAPLPYVPRKLQLEYHQTSPVVDREARVIWNINKINPEGEK